MNYIVGRLAVDLHELGLAHESFHQLLSHKTRLVAPHQQSLYLQEFLLAMKVSIRLYKLLLPSSCPGISVYEVIKGELSPKIKCG